MNREATKKAPKGVIAPKKKRMKQSLDAKKARAGWIFVLPFVLVFLLVYVPIVVDSINYSFNEINFKKGGGYSLDWVGWGNYETALFENATFVPTLVDGIKSLVFNIPAIVIFSLFMAVLLNQKMRGRAAFRAIFFVPVILATGLIEEIDLTNSMESYMSSSGVNMGGDTATATQIMSDLDFKNLFENMKLGDELVEYVVGIVNNIYDVVNKSGVQMLIFLAGLQSISPAIYESCSIDGATAWETFWKITLPMISPMILVNTVYTVIDSFTSADNRVMSFISEIYQQAGGTTLSAAMSWMYFLIVILMIAVVAAILSAFVFYQRRDS